MRIKLIAIMSAMLMLLAIPAQASTPKITTTTPYKTCAVNYALDYQASITWYKILNPTRYIPQQVNYRLSGSLGIKPPKAYYVEVTYWDSYGDFLFTNDAPTGGAYSGSFSVSAPAYEYAPVWGEAALFDKNDKVICHTSYVVVN